MVFSIIAKNASQVGQTIVRGGRLTVLGSSGVTESPINQGGLLAYEVPQFKNAVIKGTMTPTNFGTDNTFFQVELFDSQSGRLIPIVRSGTVGLTVSFELKVTQLRPRPEDPQDQEMQIHGDGVNDGTAEWYAEIIEKPN